MSPVLRFLRLRFFLRERGAWARKCLSTADPAFEASRRMFAKLGNAGDADPVEELIQLKSLLTSLLAAAVREKGPL